MNKCNCNGCEFLRKYRRLGNSRCEYYCEHENQKHIRDYYAEKGILSMPGFIGFGKGEIQRKTTPGWCPKEAKK